MHEFGIVEDLIVAYLGGPAGRGLEAPLSLVRLRYGPGLTADSVEQAFKVHSEGTPLAAARLELEPLRVSIRCPCGLTLAPDKVHAGVHESGEDHDHGLPYLSCPGCGAVHGIPRFNSIELVHAE